MGETYPRFTVAAVQASPVFLDREKTINKAVRLIEEAADKGAVIIGFPELFIAGHPMLWYLAKKSNPLRGQGELFKLLVKNGVKVPSPETERLCATAKKAHSYVVIGMSEVDTLYPGTLYNSQLLISDKGEIMGVHRKLVPTAIEKLIYSQGDGSYLNAFDTQYGKLSAMVCGEHANSLYKYALLAMGTQVHVAGWIENFKCGLHGVGGHREPVIVERGAGNDGVGEGHAVGQFDDNGRRVGEFGGDHGIDQVVSDGATMDHAEIPFSGRQSDRQRVRDHQHLLVVGAGIGAEVV